MRKSFPLLLLAAFLMMGCTQKSKILLVLHTNDTHSQIEPKKDGTCGYARRMGVIEQERKQNPDLLLLDAGDFCQGTPYFNYFNGRVEVEAMNMMGYDAATIGNHEFDNGLDSLAMLFRLAQFPIVCANYDVTGSPLEGLVKPYVVLDKGGVKVGVFGLGVNPEGLIAMYNFLPLHYLDPIPVANEMADILRNDEHCDVVICLSHLGTQVKQGKCDSICDECVARNSRNIDLIVGGHTHKMYVNHYINDLDGNPVLLSQMGKSGGAVGKITVEVNGK